MEESVADAFRALTKRIAGKSRRAYGSEKDRFSHSHEGRTQLFTPTAHFSALERLAAPAALHPVPSHSAVDNLMNAVVRGLKLHEPEELLEGSSGVYIIRDHDTSQKIAVFKPLEEEANMPSNRKGYAGRTSRLQGLVKGVLGGEGGLREALSYMFDQGALGGHAHVPCSVLVKLNHPVFGGERVGALCAYVESVGSSEDFGLNVLSGLSTQRVQALALLDVVLGNCDRHAGNILVVRNENHFEPVPIDHAYSLPELAPVSVSEFTWEWMEWPQVQHPLVPELVACLSNLDIEKWVAIMMRCGVRKECVEMFRVMSSLAKLALLRPGHCLPTLKDLGAFCMRSVSRSNHPSELERLLCHAERLAAVEVGLGSSALRPFRVSSHCCNLMRTELASMLNHAKCDIRGSTLLPVPSGQDIEHTAAACPA